MKVVYGLLGFLCFGVGAVGVVIPLLPTTPLLLLAAFFFARSSERFNRWFLSTRLYRRHLESFVKNRAMTLKTKLCILLPVSAMLVFAFFSMSNFYGRLVVALLLGFKYWYFFTQIKTIPTEKPGKQKVKSKRGGR
ncbi:MAG: ybaN [Oscillospiraceae bacterium]|nr:ybaN [Oscillospiraceae bacterium]